MNTRPNPPKPPTLRDSGLRKWMEDRGFNYDQFVERVGNDPDDPVTPKERLAENTINLRGDHISKGTVYRWLAQMKWEMTNAAT